MSYDAFISYSHAADAQLAPRLQDGLQRLAKPWWRRRSLHVFRDDTGLTANPGLWSSIEWAMDDSEWFVFLASPEAAKSPWVERELSHWLEHRGPDRLLPVVTGGTWLWDSVRNDFNMAASSAVPPVLASAFAEEPRHVDMTWARSEDQVDLRNGRFRDQVAEIAAPVHGMAKDDLEGADVREHRRTKRWVWGAAAALLLLTGLSVIAGLVAMRNADEAATQRDEASLQKISAENSATEADQQKDTAEKARSNAETQQTKALAAKRRADAEAARALQQESAAKQAEAATQEALDNESAARADESVARGEADANALSAKASQRTAEANASEAATNAQDARNKAAEAAANAAEATRQSTAAKASESAALASEQHAVAAQRETAQALSATQQAKNAETTARGHAERSAAEARAAQTKAEAAAAAETAARKAESQARGAAETEALASASAAQSGRDGGLSLLLGVEAARHGAQAGTAPAMGHLFLRATPAGTQPTNAELRPGPADTPESTTGRRALFEAVTAAQGGADSYRVDRFMPFPADMADPPVLLWKPVVSPDGRYLAAAELPDSYRGSRGPVPTRVFVWDLQSKTPSVKVLAGHTEVVATLAFAGDGATLVTQDVPYDLSTTAPTTRVWDVNTGRQLLERSAVMFVDPTSAHIALQSWGVAQVEIVDGKTGLVTAVQPGVLSSTDGTQDHPYIETPFSRDGYYAYGQSGGRAVLWDLSAGGVITIPLAGPTALFTSTPRVAPDGSGLAVAVENGTDLSFFDAASGAHLLSFPVTGADILSLEFNEDGTRLAVLDVQGHLLVLDNDGDDQNDTWAANVPSGEIGFDRTGRFVTVTVPLPESIFAYATQIFDIRNGSSLGVFDGQLVASATAGEADLYFLRKDSTLAGISLSSGRTVLADSSDDPTQVVAVSPDGKKLAVSNRSGVRVFDLTTGAPPVRTAATSDLTLGLSYVPGTSRLIGTGFGSTPIVWDLGRVGAGSPVGLAAPSATVLGDGVTVLEPIGAGTSVRFRNLLTGDTRPGPALQAGETVDYTFAGPEGNPMAVNLTNGRAVVARGDGSTVGRVSGAVATASRDGSMLAVRRSARAIDLVDSDDLSLLRTISLDALPDDDIPAQLDSVALSTDAKMLAATNGTGTTVVWDTGTGEVVTTIGGTSADRISFPLWGVGFSPDGSRLVVKGASNTVRMYATSAADGWKLLATQQLANEYAGRVVFSPDGSLIAIDGLFLLDGETLQPITTLLAGPGSVTRFTTDGRSLVTIAADGSEGPDDFREVVAWTVSTDDLTTEACHMAGRDMTHDEWNRYMGGSGEPYRSTCA